MRKNKGFISIILAGIIALMTLSVGVALNNKEELSVGGNSNVQILPVKTFLGLTDTPSSYSGQGSKGVRVNAGATALEFYTISAGGTPAGSDTQVQFNDGGSFGGDAGLTYNKTIDALTIAGSLSVPKLLNLTTNGFIKTSAGDGTLSIDTNTYLTGNQSITLSGDVSGTGATSITTTIGNDKILESMLKAVDTASDEDILTYESTTGDFEWHTCAQITGSADLCDGNDASGAGSLTLDLADDGANESTALGEIAITGDTNSIFTEPTNDKLLIAVGNDWPKADLADALNANGANCSAGSGALGVDASGAVESCTDFEEDLSNSAGLLAALSDETGTSLAVFSNSPTFDDDFDLGSAGVRLAGADGVLTILGLGNGNDENLTFDFDNGTANNVDIASGTAVSNIGFGAITLTAGGFLGNATTATALAANPADCSANQFAISIVASGALTCAAIADADVPNNITIDLATLASTVTTADAGGDTTTWLGLATAQTGSLALSSDAELTYNATTNALSTTTFIGALTGNSSTATALASDPADCGANTFAISIVAAGTLTCAAVSTSYITDGTIAFADINSTQTLAGNPANGDSSVWHATTGLIFEGATSDTLEGLLISADITGTDKTWTLPNTTGTLLTTGDTGTVTSTIIFDGTITVADTAITAGRSLTWSTNDLVADAELYTDTKCYRIESPVAGDDDKSIWFAKNAFTITSIWAESDQTVTFMLQVDDGTPADVDSVDLAPAAGTAEDTSLNGDATMAAGDRLDLDLVSVSGTPTWVSICWTGTWDD